MPKGYFAPVLHSHLPFVKHPGFEYFLEEHWLFEAIDETYIPLLMGFKELEEKGVNFKNGEKLSIGNYDLKELKKFEV